MIFSEGFVLNEISSLQTEAIRDMEKYPTRAHEFAMAAMQRLGGMQRLITAACTDMEATCRAIATIQAAVDRLDQSATQIERATFPRYSTRNTGAGVLR